jgi:hypothetical protein
MLKTATPFVLVPGERRKRKKDGDKHGCQEDLGS